MTQIRPHLHPGAIIPYRYGPTNPGSNQKPKPAPPGKPGRREQSANYGPGNPGTGQKPPNRPPIRPKRIDSLSTPIRTRELCFYHDDVLYYGASLISAVLTTLLQALHQSLKESESCFHPESWIGTRINPIINRLRRTKVMDTEICI